MNFKTKELKELEDLLNFDYGSKEPASTEAELYTALRRQSSIEHDAAEAERRARAAAEEKARNEARAHAEARARAAAEERARYEARVRAATEERARYEARVQAEARARAAAEERARYEARVQAEAKARAVAEEKARSEARAQAEARLLEERRAAEQERLRMNALEEEAARKKAQEEAYARYRANSANNAGVTSSTKANRKAEKKAAKRAAAGAASKKAARGAAKAAKGAKFSKALATIYVIALAAFAAVMTVMNVLPFKYLIAMYVVLGILSLIIVAQLCRVRIKKWARALATFMAIILISVYGLGCAYALGTLDFLSGSSVKNDAKVGKISEDSFNVLITGMDVWGTIDEPGRSDVNMIVTVNPKTATILLTSIPRDYEIRMPNYGYATDKLTHTGFYSQDTTIQAIEDLLSIDINYYVKVNFDTIVRFVDAIGGLDIYNETEFRGSLNDHLYEQGNIHVQGRGALYYARERKAFSEGDNQRVKNQQIIFSAMLEKAMSSKTMILSYSNVLNSMDDYFQMSFSSREVRTLVKMQLAKNPKWKIYKNTLYGQGANKTTYTGGSQLLYVTEQNATSIAYSSGLINAVLEGQTLEENEDKTISIVGAEEGENQ
ncbi:MAG: LCP family protein [Clostridiales bacterium]|nr:LCP family protein [Candidatus Crickella caballi]